MSVTLMTETNLYKDDAIADGLEDASKVATNYLAYNAQDGLTVGRTGQSERAVITSDGMEIYDGQNDNIAEFKAVTRIGREDEGNLRLDYRSLQLQDLDGEIYVHLSDLRDSSGELTITETFEYVRTGIYIPYNVHGSGKMYLDGHISDKSDVLSFTIKNEEQGLFFEIPAEGFNIIDGYLSSVQSSIYAPRINLQIISSYATAHDIPNVYYDATIIYKDLTAITNATRAYTFGTRSDDGFIGFESFSNGANILGQGNYSHGEGNGCKAYGECSHAEGGSCQAGIVVTGTGRRATTAVSGHYSHAEGYESKAYSDYSHASGLSCKTGMKAQFVCGRYNVQIGNDYATGNVRPTAPTPPSSTGSTLFIVGGGSSDNDRFNALTVTAIGNLTIAGTLTQSSDKRLKLHHAYLSDQEQDVTSFVESLKPAYFEKDQAKHLGFYAQDVQLADKWNTMVSEDTNGYLALGYTEIIAPLVAYVQNQQKKIDSLEERIARLEQLINQQ